MKQKDKNFKVKEYIFISLAYMILIGILLFLTIKFKELPRFYYGLSVFMLIVLDIALPKDKYIKKLTYLWKLIYILFAIYQMDRLVSLIFY